jgi:hypothetical protein
MRLDSDFTDWYDHAFDSRHATTPILSRRADTGRHRRLDHDELLSAGFRVPLRGAARELSALPPKLRPRLVVWYQQPSEHCGDGKRVAPLDMVLAEDPDAYVVDYLPSEGLLPTSWRMIGIGELTFWMRYRSYDTWRSNVGRVMIDDAGAPPEELWVPFARLRPRPTRPLLAVDFVRWDGVLHAVDLNPAPGLRGTFVEDRVRSTTIHEVISRWVVGAPE